MIKRGEEGLFGAAVETVEDPGDPFVPVCLTATCMRGQDRFKPGFKR